MKCHNCEFYYSGVMENSCALTLSENFPLQYDCDLVNDDGTLNANHLDLIGGPND